MREEASRRRATRVVGGRFGGGALGKTGSSSLCWLIRASLGLSSLCMGAHLITPGWHLPRQDRSPRTFSASRAACPRLADSSSSTLAMCSRLCTWYSNHSLPRAETRRAFMSLMATTTHLGEACALAGSFSVAKGADVGGSVVSKTRHVTRLQRVQEKCATCTLPLHAEEVNLRDLARRRNGFAKAHESGTLRWGCRKPMLRHSHAVDVPAPDRENWTARHSRIRLSFTTSCHLLSSKHPTKSSLFTRHGANL